MAEDKWMQAPKANAQGPEAVLRSPTSAPYEFTVKILAEPSGAETARRFEVTTQDIETREFKTKTYVLAGREHKHFLNLLNGIAQDFGTRVPRHCRPEPTPTFQAEYSELLTRNLSPEILYGYGDPAVLLVEGKD